MAGPGLSRIMTMITITSPTILPTFTPPHLPINPPSISDTPTAIQSLAFEVVGVLFAGAGLILLVLQLRQHHSNRRSEDREQVELQRNIQVREEDI